MAAHSRWFSIGVAALAVGLAVALHGFAAADATGPVWPEDEIGPLANAWVIAGVGEPWSLAHLAYYPGWSVLVAPIWWFTQDPAVAYRAAALLAAAVAIATIAPFTFIARRSGLAVPWAVTVAAVVSMSPARTLMSNYVLTENFLVLVFALLLLAGQRYLERATVLRALVFAAATAFTFFTHGRAAPVVVAALLVMAVSARGRVKVAVLAIGSTLALTALAYLGYVAIVGQIYVSGTGREQAGISGLLASSLLGSVRSLAGQLWYQLGAWSGLSLLGLVVVVRAAVGEVRRRRPGPATWVALAILGLTALSALMLGRSLGDPATVTRVDYWFYGRYLDAFFAPLAVVGLATALARRAEIPYRVFAGVTAAVSLTFLVVNLPVIERGPVRAILNTAGILVWEEVFEFLPSKRAVVVFALAALAVVAVARYVPRGGFLVLVPVAVFFAASTVTIETRTVDPVNRVWRAGADLADVVDEAVPSDLPVAFDLVGAGRAEENRATFWMVPREVTTFDSSLEEPPGDIVIARSDWSAATRLGAVRVGSVRIPDNAVWVMPGALQDELVLQGAVERTSGDPTLRSFDSHVAIDAGPPDGTTCSRSRPPCLVEATVTNEGRDTWSPLGTLGGVTGSVRLVAWWQSGLGTWPTLTELPRSVPPGGSVQVDIMLTAPPELGLGPVRVELGLVQEGISGFPGPEEHLPAVEIAVVD